jgi:hypothetical protein
MEELRMMGRRAVVGMVVGVAVLWGGMAAHAASFLDAMSKSQKTGRPLLALVTSPTCVPCQRLKQVLATDRGVQQELQAFVMLEMEYSGAEFSGFRGQFPLEVPGVPMMYIVRADGTLMYGRFGAMSGSELTSVLGSQRVRAGRALTDQQCAVVEARYHRAVQLLQDGDVYQALRLLEPITRISSHATSVRQSRELHERVVVALDRWLTQLDSQLAQQQLAHKAAYQVAHMYVHTQSAPAVRKRAGEMLVKYERREGTRVAIRQGKELVRARLQEQHQQLVEAAETYARIVSLDQTSPTAIHAARKLEALRRPVPGSNVSGPVRATPAAGQRQLNQVSARAG